MSKGIKGLVWVLAAVGILLAGCVMHHHPAQCEHCHMHGKAGMTAPAASDQLAARNDILYVCDCGATCKCNTLSTKPGKCGCGQPLAAYHVIKVEGDEALLCACGNNCTCAIDPKDNSKCGCGKPVKRVSLKGTGIYFCNCGGSCACNTVSDHPGQCKCGMQLKKVD